MSDKPKRCSACFKSFMPNHNPQKFINEDGTVRYMHKVCKMYYEQELKSHIWPAVRVMPDRDE